MPQTKTNLKKSKSQSKQKVKLQRQSSQKKDLTWGVYEPTQPRQRLNNRHNQKLRLLLQSLQLKRKSQRWGQTEALDQTTQNSACLSATSALALPKNLLSVSAATCTAGLASTLGWTSQEMSWFAPCANQASLPTLSFPSTQERIMRTPDRSSRSQPSQIGPQELDRTPNQIDKGLVVEEETIWVALSWVLASSLLYSLWTSRGMTSLGPTMVRVDKMLKKCANSSFNTSLGCFSCLCSSASSPLEAMYF